VVVNQCPADSLGEAADMTSRDRQTSPEIDELYESDRGRQQDLTNHYERAAPFGTRETREGGDDGLWKCDRHPRPDD